MRTILFLIFTYTCFVNIYAQSPFSFEVLSRRHKVIEILYDGHLGSVADSDTAVIRPFKLLSVGALKEVSAVAKGQVYIVLSYRSNQTVIIESGGDYFGNSYEWKSIENPKLAPFYSILHQPLKGSNRIHLSRYQSGYNVYLLNIKDESIGLFKWMMATARFD